MASRLLTPLAAALFLATSLPAANADTTWDFTVEYNVASDGSVDFLILGAIPYVIECPSGWQVQQQSSLRAADGSTALRVYGSYLLGKLRVEDQADGVVDVITQTCSGLPTLRAADSAPTTGGLRPIDGNWHEMAATNGWTLMHPADRYFNFCCYDVHECARTSGQVATLGDWPTLVPFTGDVYFSVGGQFSYERDYWVSSFWIAGTGPWPMLHQDQTRDGAYWSTTPKGLDSPPLCNAIETGDWRATWSDGYPTEGIGHFRARADYCDIACT